MDTRKFILAFIAGIVLWGATNKANAQEWLLCGSCTTAEEFESFALQTPQPYSREGQNTHLYAVGNTQTGVFRYVEVTYVPDGQVPAFKKQDSFPVYAFKNRKSSPAVRGGYHGAWSYTGSGNTAVSVPATPDEEATFAATVRLSANHILVVVPPTVVGHESFLQAVPEALGRYLAIRMAEHNPAWGGPALSADLYGKLVQALKMYFGKGPGACAIFQNGDSACYQVHPNDPNAIQYLVGSAKDRFGTSISSTGGIGGSSSGSGLDMNFSDPGIRGWGTSSYSLWLFCAFKGGVLDRCWTEIIMDT
jgi:hypothetical protein